MEPKEKIIEFVNKLPVSQEEKGALLDILEEDGMDTLKIILRIALEESALKTSFKESVVKAENGLDVDMEKIEREAEELAKEISKETDSKKIEELRSQIGG